MSLSIRAARPADSALIFALVRELADYEKLANEVDASEQTIAAALFTEAPRLFCDIAEWNGEPAGFSVWFLNYSTFRGRHGIYLEDLFVRPAYRGRGIGKALMARLAQVALNAVTRVLNGRCWTGMRRRSRSTNRSARRCWMSGRSAA